jgi:hypothetical protein
MMNTEVAGSVRDGRTRSRLSPEEMIVKRIEDLTYRGIVDVDGPAIGTIRRWLVKQPLEDLLEGVDRSFAVHIRMDGSEVDPASFKKAFNKVPSMTEMLVSERARPWIGKILYIQGILRNRTELRSLKWFDYLEHAHVCGAPLEELESLAKKVDTIDDLSALEARLDAWLLRIGKPF